MSPCTLPLKPLPASALPPMRRPLHGFTAATQGKLRGSRLPCTSRPEPASSTTGTTGTHPGPALPEDLVLRDIRVVLVAPKTAGNVGAVARACGNFEAPQLWVVSPRCDLASEEVAWMACDTVITDRMVSVDSLEEALADTIGSIGFTRRAGATRYTHACIAEMLQEYPQAIPGMIGRPAASSPSSPKSSLPDAGGSGGTTALVFGREESGLTGSELRLVSHACAIPSGRLQPSLNLSHAATVVLAECFNRRSHFLAGGVNELGGSAPAPTSSTPTADGGGGSSGSDRSGAEFATAGDLEVLIRKVAVVAEASGVSTDESRKASPTRLPLGHLRALVGRAKVTAAEARSLHGFASAVIDKILGPGHPMGSRRAGSGTETPKKAEAQAAATAAQKE